MANGWYQLENGRRTTTRASGVPVPQKKTAAALAPVSPPVTHLPAPEPEPIPAPPAPPLPPPEERRDPAPPRFHPDPYSDELPVLHAQTIGPNGPVVMQDQVLHEALDTFFHSQMMERRVHVKGWGAFGHFETTRSMAEYTTLPFLQAVGTRVSTVTRLSPSGPGGTPDTARTVWGFSTKFYAKEGPFDLLCNHISVFPVRDAIRVPEFLKALSPSPVSNLPDPGRFWSFVVRAPESVPFVLRLYSDAGTVKSLTHMPSHGVNTFVWRNAAGARHFVKYHWRPLAGVEYLTAVEAAELACKAPDRLGRELWELIRAGGKAEYELCVQLMEPDRAEELSYDPLDATKLWDERQFPMISVGKLTLDRNPENHRDQVEKLAFSPANLLPGAEFSDDKVLQGRSFAYYDAQRYRLGPNFRSIPVNAQGDWTPAWQVSSGLGTCVSGEQVRMPVGKSDDFVQAGVYYDSLNDAERSRLADNLAADLKQVGGAVQGVVLEYLKNASEGLGESVAQKVNK